MSTNSLDEATREFARAVGSMASAIATALGSFESMLETDPGQLYLWNHLWHVQGSWLVRWPRGTEFITVREAIVDVVVVLIIVLLLVAAIGLAFILGQRSVS